MGEGIWIRVDDTTSIYAQAMGEGSPILMIHGACTDSSFFSGAAECLAARHRVIACDRRGYGLSATAPGATFDVATQARDVAVLLEEIVKGGRAAVVAHSAGCCIALELAAQRPELVSALVLHEPALMDCLEADDPVFQSIDDALALGETGLFSAAAFGLFSLEGEAGAGPSGVDPSRFDGYCEHFIAREARGIYAYRPDYDRIARIPVLVGLGERSRDTYHGRGCPELVRRTGGRLVLFPGGHNCACEMPFEFAALAEGCLGLCGERLDRRDS